MTGMDGEAVAQLVEGRCFNPQLLWAACQSVLGRNTEPQIAPDAVSLVYECV